MPKAIEVAREETAMMGDTTGSLFKSVKAKLGMNNVKPKGHQQHEGINAKQGTVSDVVDEAFGHPSHKGSHRKDLGKSTLDKPSKSREMMLAAYKGTCTPGLPRSDKDHPTKRSLVLGQRFILRPLFPIH